MDVFEELDAAVKKFEAAMESRKRKSGNAKREYVCRPLSKEEEKRVREIFAKRGARLERMYGFKLPHGHILSLH